MNASPNRQDRHLKRAASIMALAGALAMCAGLAPASAGSDGNWWYTALGVPTAQAQGITGDGVKIAVIDMQINPDLPGLVGTDLKVFPKAFCGGSPSNSHVTDDSRHGSEVVALLIGNGKGSGAVRGIAPKARVTFYAMGPSDCRVAGSMRAAYGNVIHQAVTDGNRIVSVSLGINDLPESAKAEVKAGQDAGVIFVSSTANHIEQFSLKYLNSLSGVLAVGGLDDAGRPMKQDRTPDSGPLVNPQVDIQGPAVDIAGDGSASGDDWSVRHYARGTSVATPLTAGVLADAWQKYPKATANQLLQSVVRNTGLDDHPLTLDKASGKGYGPLSLVHMLRVDPTQYPDTNPLTEGKEALPDPSPAATAKSRTPEPSAPTSPAVTPTSVTNGMDSVLTGALAVLAALAVAIVVALRARRKKHKDAADGSL
ncbi:S8 family peptidase [Arthrobacter bambusae]|uniref:Subtilisin family serine protease n=1 Tax=Arthrobacter bambusae TaxID=1338426 RepID=A0AAW8DD59_9MICC|nr:S8 family serine peptidase [Arthrobacter bambusae]MDP9904564.1 subtilisin family serine protease [Arthrobacter bambusae]MDQ0129379.1 subtilisin family serine protease [Arthrobacter bambusae]MDQ0181008.1 subtilisin family serine protease [Arthrobacter bambusae]